MKNGEKEVVAGRRFVNILFDIFGYSFVGLLAYCFGLVLQNYNTDGGLVDIFLNYSSDTQQIILIIVIQVLLIFLFGHVYAMVILLGKTDCELEKGMDVCAVVGHWLETVLLCVVIFLGMIQIFFPTVLSVNFWYVVLISSGIYISSFMAYRRLKNEKYENLKYTSRYVLACPAALMIGFNILAGANICAMLKGDIICFWLEVIFWIGLVLVFFCKQKFCKIISIFIGALILLGGLLSLSTELDSNTILVLKNFFLASIVAIFLSVFESWYVMFRQMKNCVKEEYVKICMVVVSMMPAFVALLYPIQNFNFIYYIFFWMGMMITDYICFFIVFPIVNQGVERDKVMRRKIAIARAFCGISTLIFLMLDKYWIYNPVWHENEAFLISDDVLAVISLVVSVVGLFLEVIINNRSEGEEHIIVRIRSFFADLNKNMLREGCIMLRWASFIVVIMVSDYLYGFLNGNAMKAKLSSLALIIYTIFTMFIGVKISLREGGKK